MKQAVRFTNKFAKELAYILRGIEKANNTNAELNNW